MCQQHSRWCHISCQIQVNYSAYAKLGAGDKQNPNPLCPPKPIHRLANNLQNNNIPLCVCQILAFQMRGPEYAWKSVYKVFRSSQSAIKHHLSTFKINKFNFS